MNITLQAFVIYIRYEISTTARKDVDTSKLRDR